MYKIQQQIIPSKNMEPFIEVNDLLSQSKKEIVIFSPYIKVSALIKLKLLKNIDITIVTKLSLEDLHSGASDIDLYQYCQSNNIKLFINNSIHLKVYISDWRSCIFGSSNLTNSGLAIVSKYNLELNGFIDDIDNNTIIYLRTILHNSILMTESMFDEAYQLLEQLPEKMHLDNLKLSKINSNKDYLISSLPMSYTIDKLYELISNNYQSESKEEINCAIHDSVLFDLSSSLPIDEFKKDLAIKFFKSNFIRDLMLFIDSDDRYFGSVKKWIQLNCESVPVPSMRDLTGNIQVLYKWIADLSDGEYVIDRPNHSERIRRKQ